MNTLNALTVSIALLGALATYLALGPLGGMFLIWVAFIAWGGFYAFGADTAALKNLVVCGIFGAVVAWAVAVVILSLPFADQIGLPLWAAIAVGAGIVVVVLAANSSPSHHPCDGVWLCRLFWLLAANGRRAKPKLALVGVVAKLAGYRLYFFGGRRPVWPCFGTASRQTDRC